MELNVLVQQITDQIQQGVKAGDAISKIEDRDLQRDVIAELRDNESLRAKAGISQNDTLQLMADYYAQEAALIAERQAKKEGARKNTDARAPEPYELRSKRHTETHQDLNKPLGLLVAAFTTMTEDQRLQVLEFQSGLLAVAMAEKDQADKTDFFKIRSMDDVRTLVSSKAGTVEGWEAIHQDAAAIVNSGTFIPKEYDRVPLSGAIAVDLGFVPKDVKETLLDGQAAERVLLAQQGKGGKVVETLKDALVLESWDAVKGSSSFRNIERDYAKFSSAQSLNHLADIMAAGIATKPELADDVMIQKAQSAMQVLAEEAIDQMQVKLKPHADVLKPDTLERLAEANQHHRADEKDVFLLTRDVKKGFKTLFGQLLDTVASTVIAGFEALVEKRIEKAAELDPMRNVGERVREQMQRRFAAGEHSHIRSH